MDELLTSIQQEFNKRYQNTPLVNALLEKVEKNKASYKEVHQYAVAVGNILSESIQTHLSDNITLNEGITEELARQILEPTLADNYNLIADVAEQVQKKLNEDAGIRLQTIRPALNTNRIEGLIRKSASYDTYEKAEWLFGEPIVNFAQSVVNDSIRANVDSQARAGLRPKLIRTAEIGCCKWCANLAGVYDYDKAPDDVYRQHKKCRCIVEYAPGDGTFTNVHTKKEYAIQKQNRIDRARQIDVTKNKTTYKDITNNKTTYKDITNNWKQNINKNKSVVRELDSYIAPDGKKYMVDGTNVVLDYTNDEKKTGEVISKALGEKVYMCPKVAGKYTNVSTPDYLVGDSLERWDKKMLKGKGKDALRDAIKRQEEQADNFVIDIANWKGNRQDVLNQADRVFLSRNTEFVQTIAIIRNDEVIKVIRKR